MAFKKQGSPEVITHKLTEKEEANEMNKKATNKDNYEWKTVNNDKNKALISEVTANGWR